MGIYVSWGNHQPCYDETKSDYNSLINQWDRYSENIKRGWVLFSSSVYEYNGLQLTRELMEWEEFRIWGFDILRKNPGTFTFAGVVSAEGSSVGSANRHSAQDWPQGGKG